MSCGEIAPKLKSGNAGLKIGTQNAIRYPSADISNYQFNSLIGTANPKGQSMAIGPYAMENFVLPGYYNNLATGYQCLQGTKGQVTNQAFYNTGYGIQVMQPITSGANNAAFSNYALSSLTTGSYNSCFGSGILGYLTTGNNVSAYGYLVGQTITTESNIILIGNGSNCDIPSAGTSNYMAIRGTGSNIISATGINGTPVITLGGATTVSGTTASTSNTTGIILTAGGVATSNTTDASSATNGGSFTTAGGMAVAKKLYVGTALQVGVNGTTGGQFTLDGNSDTDIIFRYNTAFKGAIGYSTAGSYMYYQNSSQDMMRFYDGSGGALALQPSSGGVIVGAASVNASAILQADSTTKGFLPPRMTTIQKNAIGTPAAGLIVFDTTLSKLCVYSGAAWQTVTSV